MTAFSTTSCETARDALPTVERPKRTVVAIATGDEALSAALTTRLVSKGHAVALTYPMGNSARLLFWLDESRADVLLLDERWLRRLDPQAAHELRVRYPGLRVLVLCERAGAALAEEVVRSRFRGLLLASGADDVVKAIDATERGELWIPRAILAELLLERPRAAAHERSDLDAGASLTRREAQVIGYLRRGLANKQIADALAIREDTVKKHLRSAYTKLGVHRRSEIIAQGAARPTGR